MLRAAREDAEAPYVVTIAATDPANPYGALLSWPDWTAAAEQTLRASRSAGARVILVDGRLAAWIGRGDRAMLISLPSDEPDRSRVGRAIAQELVTMAHRAPEGSRGWLIEEINGGKAAADPVTPFLLEAGFAVTAMGLQLRVAGRARRAGPANVGIAEGAESAEDAEDSELSDA